MTPPPIYTHACNVYQAFLDSESTFEADERMAVEYGVKPGDKVYVGHWSTEFPKGRDGMPGESTQQKAYAFLLNVGCLEVLRRGGRDYPGVILLRREPTLEDAKEASTENIRNGRLGTVQIATQANTRRIEGLEGHVEDLRGEVNALTRDIELQLRKLSARMDEALKAREQG